MLIFSVVKIKAQGFFCGMTQKFYLDQLSLYLTLHCNGLITDLFRGAK